MRRLEPQQWLDAVQGAVAGGHSTFVTLMGVDVDGEVQLWLRLRAAERPDAVLCVAAATALPSLVPLFAEADWAEREAAETFGIAFTGRVIDSLLLAQGAAPTMRKDVLLEPRQSTPWPGEKDPGGTTPRRRTLPPGVAGGAR